MACPLCSCPVHDVDDEVPALLQAFWLGVEALDTESNMHRALGNDSLANEAHRDATVLREFANAQALRFSTGLPEADPREN